MPRLALDLGLDILRSSCLVSPHKSASNVVLFGNTKYYVIVPYKQAQPKYKEPTPALVRPEGPDLRSGCEGHNDIVQARKIAESKACCARQSRKPEFVELHRAGSEGGNRSKRIKTLAR